MPLNMNAPSSGTPGRDQHQVGAHVGEQVDLQAEDPAVGVGGERESLDLVAAVVDGQVALAAGLGPLDRPAEPLGQQQASDLLAVHLELGAEPAADVGGDHPELVLGDAGRRRPA